MIDPKKLLWFDGFAGALVGVLVVTLSVWLSRLYQLPYNFVLFMGVVNLLYASYSLSLARKRGPRPLILIQLLALANVTWGVLCLRWADQFWDTASVFGLAQLVLEGLFVGGLGLVEWRWRKQLTTA